MSEWPIGLSTGCFYRTSFFDVLPAIREGGFTMLELCSHPAHLDFHRRSDVERAARLLQEVGAEAWSYHAPFAPEIDISAPDDEHRAHARREMHAALEAAARLEAWRFVLHPGPERSEPCPAAERYERARRAAETIDEIATRCRELGVRLVLENLLGHLLFGRPSDMGWIMGAIEENELGVCLDTGHAHLSGQTTKLVRLFRAQLEMVHLSDNRGERDDHLPPGAGSIDWAWLLRLLRASDFHGGMIIELADEPSRPPESIVRSAREARSFLRRVSREVAREEDQGFGRAPRST